MSFRDPFIDFTPEPLPIQGLNFGVILIAPFWDDIETRESVGGGRLFFRQSNDEALLTEVGTAISDVFMPSFSPTLLFIATWDEVTLTFGSLEVFI